MPSTPFADKTTPPSRSSSSPELTGFDAADGTGGGFAEVDAPETQPASGSDKSRGEHPGKSGDSEPVDELDAGAGIDPDDERIIGLLAVGFSQVKAAAELGISSRTIRRRLQNPEFKARVNQRKRDLHAESWSRVLGLRDKASDVLAASLESEEERFRLQAARSVYEIGARVRREQAVEELVDRVAELESEIARRQVTKG